VAIDDDLRSDRFRERRNQGKKMTARDNRMMGARTTRPMENACKAAVGPRLAVPTVKAGHDDVDLRAYVYVLLMVVLGSTTAAAAKFAVAELPVSVVPAMRFGLAGVCLLPWVLRRGVLLRMIREDALLLVITAALCVPINQGFFLSAARLGPTSHVGIFYATCPLVVLLLAWSMRIERPDRARLWGVLASVAGIVVIGIGNFWSGGHGSSAEIREIMLADLLLLGAVSSWGGYIAVSKPLVARHGAMPAVAATVLVGCLLSLPLAVWTWPGLASFAAVSQSAWVALVVLGLVITPLGWAFQNLSLRRFDASQVATFSNGSPVLTIVWGMWLFGEQLTPALIAGGALTLGGIYWASRTKRPEPEPRTSRLEPTARIEPRPCGLHPVAAVLTLSPEAAAQ
jgi:drug/metabolite transporter (DMT)-like permease